MDLAAAPVAPNLAEHHVAQRRLVDGLLAEDLLQRPVDVDRVDDRVRVSGNVEQRVRLRVLISGLLPSSTRLDERVEPLRLDPLVGVGILGSVEILKK
jgi:hypothetical protein